MELTPDSDQIALQTATADWCRAHMPIEAARERPAGLWGAIAAMGWVGMTAPAMGLDHATEALVFAELGRFLAPVGLLSSAVAARWCDAGGKTALALSGSDGVLRLIDSERTNMAIGLFDGVAGWVACTGISSPSPSLDLSASVARIDGKPVVTVFDDRRVALHLQLLAAAFAVGCADAARDMATGYAKIREQFERPIGWFQALKHMCADMAVRAAVARSQLYFAACALDAEQVDAPFHVAAAKRLADRAAIDTARANIQVHGGIGMTDEGVPHLCLKRAHLLQFVAAANRDLLLA